MKSRWISVTVLISQNSNGKTMKKYFVFYMAFDFTSGKRFWHLKNRIPVGPRVKDRLVRELKAAAYDAKAVEVTV